MKIDCRTEAQIFDFLLFRWIAIYGRWCKYWTRISKPRAIKLHIWIRIYALSCPKNCTNIHAYTDTLPVKPYFQSEHWCGSYININTTANDRHLCTGNDAFYFCSYLDLILWRLAVVHSSAPSIRQGEDKLTIKSIVSSIETSRHWTNKSKQLVSTKQFWN